MAFQKILGRLVTDAGAEGALFLDESGEMVDLSKIRPRSSSRTVAQESAPAGPVVFPFRRKMRTIVKVFDVLRHTSQFHFEKTFNSGSRSSQGDRRYVVTWPEPMAALTELYTQGTRRDGRVELSGQLDGNRLEAFLALNIRRLFSRR